ncbi:hypothetical protein [Acinetobacter baumannii]
MLDQKNAQLRLLSHDDLEMVLQWRNHDDIRKWMVNSDIIALSDHFAWFERNKNRTDRLFYIFEYQQQPQGYISFVMIPNSTAYEWGFGRYKVVGHHDLNVDIDLFQAPSFVSKQAFNTWFANILSQHLYS